MGGSRSPAVRGTARSGQSTALPMASSSRAGLREAALPRSIPPRQPRWPVSSPSSRQTMRRACPTADARRSIRPRAACSRSCRTGRCDTTANQSPLSSRNRSSRPAMPRHWCERRIVRRRRPSTCRRSCLRRSRTRRRFSVNSNQPAIAGIPPRRCGRQTSRSTPRTRRRSKRTMRWNRMPRSRSGTAIA